MQNYKTTKHWRIIIGYLKLQKYIIWNVKNQNNQIQNNPPTKQDNTVYIAYLWGIKQQPRMTVRLCHATPTTHFLL